jgi:hypothetical protein
MEWLAAVAAAVGRALAACWPAETVLVNDRRLRTTLIAEGCVGDRAWPTGDT